MARILIIEPQRSLRDNLKKSLEYEGYQTKTAVEASEALLLVDQYQPDLIILNRCISDSRGESICWDLKREYPDIPIILLVDEGEADRVMRHFRAGADDFTIKPIRLESLLSRIKIRLSDRETRDTKLKVGDLVLDLDTFEAKRNGQKINLTPQEFKLLKFLMRNAGRVMTRDVILSRVWSYDSDVQSRAVDVNIGYLRRKIDGQAKKKLIRTVRGFGYMVKD